MSEKVVASLMFEIFESNSVLAVSDPEPEVLAIMNFLGVDVAGFDEFLFRFGFKSGIL